MPAPKRDITPWELTTNGARQHPGDGGPGLAEASAGREMSRIPDSVAGGDPGANSRSLWQQLNASMMIYPHSALAMKHPVAPAFRQ